MTTQDLYCIAYFPVVYDAEEDCYSFGTPVTADTEHLILVEKTRMIEDAVAFLEERFPSMAENLINQGLSDWKKVAQQTAVVDHSWRTYFPRFINQQGERDFFNEYRAYKDVFAVTMKISLYGYATVYFVPQLEYNGRDIPKEPGETRYYPMVIGCDPLRPRSEQEMVGPYNFLTPLEEEFGENIKHN